MNDEGLLYGCLYVVLGNLAGEEVTHREGATWNTEDRDSFASVEASEFLSIESSRSDDELEVTTASSDPSHQPE